jgi:hypothetical protein
MDMIITMVMNMCTIMGTATTITIMEIIITTEMARIITDMARPGWRSPE